MTGVGQLGQLVLEWWQVLPEGAHGAPGVVEALPHEVPDPVQLGAYPGGRLRARFDPGIERLQLEGEGRQSVRQDVVQPSGHVISARQQFGPSLLSVGSGLGHLHLGSLGGPLLDLPAGDAEGQPPKRASSSPHGNDQPSSASPS